MSKKTEFLKTLQGMNEQDLRARLADDQQRLKKWSLRMLFLPWRILCQFAVFAAILPD